jgi:hypothetical protein
MQIVTLSDVKAALNVSFTAQDAKLTQLIEQAEGEVLQYIGAASVDDVVATHGTDSVGLAALETAVTYAVAMRWGDMGPTANIWGGGVLARLLMPYRIPSIGTGATA